MVVWDNASRSPSHARPSVHVWPTNTARHHTFGVCSEVGVEDLSVMSRYAAIERTDADVIYVQDDDVVVSDPREILAQWLVPARLRHDHVVCNMPQEFRHDFYSDNALVGFGAVFFRDTPKVVFQRWAREVVSHDFIQDMVGPEKQGFFRRTCDIVFTGLSPRFLVDVPKRNLSWAEAGDRMYRQPGYVDERQRMRDFVKRVANGR